MNEDDGDRDDSYDGDEKSDIKTFGDVKIFALKNNYVEDDDDDNDIQYGSFGQFSVWIFLASPNQEVEREIANLEHLDLQEMDRLKINHLSGISAHIHCS